jgi:hypothetical protein
LPAIKIIFVFFCLPIEVLDLGFLLEFELGVVEPELVGVFGLATGVGGLSAFKQIVDKKNEYNTRNWF